MSNTRAKIKKPLKACISHASIDHQPTQSADVIGSNDDLLSEILIRLPVTSILRFKSVSKHWQSLLSHKHFTKRYDNLSKSPGIFANDIYIPFDVENPNNPLKQRSIHSYFRLPDVTILQSCNGLLLCSTDRGPKGRRGVVKYYVFNPTTKQLALIPSVLGGPKVRETICFMGLAFHQTDCVHYKVVCVRYLNSDLKQFQVQIYSSDTRKWKVSIESFALPIRLISPGVYWNGALYWAPFYDNKSLLYFKIDAEQLQTLPVPEALKKDNVTLYLGESRGHLHLISTLNYQEDRLRMKRCEILHLNVYEMLSDHSGWFVKYQLQLDKLYDAFRGMIYRYNFFKVVDVVRGEEEEDTFIVLEIYEQIVKYNVHDRSFKQIYSLPSCYICRSSFHRYTESLTAF